MTVWAIELVVEGGQRDPGTFVKYATLDTDNEDWDDVLQKHGPVREFRAVRMLGDELAEAAFKYKAER